MRVSLKWNYCTWEAHHIPSLESYRNQGEMAHTCRGTINLASAHIDTEDSCGILLCNGARTYHLKASSEVDRQQWITVLELAKAKAIRVMKTQSGSDHSAQGVCMVVPWESRGTGSQKPLGIAVTRKSKKLWSNSEGPRSVCPLPTWLDLPSALREPFCHDVCGQLSWG